MNQYYKELYCFKDKETGEYVGDDYNPTEHLEDAIGWNTLEQAEKDLEKFDEPDKHEIFKKIVIIKEDASSLPDYEVEYNEFWKDIIEDKYGNLNRDQIMRELYDYKKIMNNCSKAYDTMTKGIISKELTSFLEVEKIFNDNFISKKEFDVYGISDDLMDIFDDCDTKQELEEEIKKYFNMNER